MNAPNPNTSTCVYISNTSVISMQVSSLLSRNTIKFSKTSEPGAADDNSQRSRLGSGTCIAVHLKFIIVGTSMGALMLFDHFQEVNLTSDDFMRLQYDVPPTLNAYLLLLLQLRHILGPCNLPGQTHHFDSVTSIAIFESSKGSATGDFLVSGSASGCIILWDYIKVLYYHFALYYPSPETCDLSHAA